jgi:hypothetical protein
MGSFLSGIFTGSNPTLDGTIGNANDVMGFGTSVGKGDIGAASDFYKTLLGGNSAAEAKLLAPQIKTVQDQAQQKINTEQQFGDRSGGTNAGNQMTLDNARGSVDDMIAKLTGGAAGGLANLGTSTLGIGLNANEIAAREAQQRLENQRNSIFGKGIGDFASTALNAAEGGMGF